MAMSVKGPFLPCKSLVLIAYKYVYKCSICNVFEDILSFLVEAVAKDVLNSIYASYIDDKIKYSIFFRKHMDLNSI